MLWGEIFGVDYVVYFNNVGIGFVLKFVLDIVKVYLDLEVWIGGYEVVVVVKVECDIFYILIVVFIGVEL